MDHDAELIIVGGGPAGCAAGLMASSLGLHALLIESRDLCAKLRGIAAISNVLAAATTGAELADSIATSLGGALGCSVLLGQAAVQVRATADYAEVQLADEGVRTAPAVVLATGVSPPLPHAAGWMTVDPVVELQPLWKAPMSELAGKTLLVFGADRPLGTVLRAHPGLDVRVVVLHTQAEHYKTDEVAGDSRVELILVTSVNLETTSNGDVRAALTDTTGCTRTVPGRAAYLNLGSKPNVLGGDVATDETGYCRPDIQHPRILIAGDLRSNGYQRIMTAYGSGSEAALPDYYQRHGLN